MGVSEDGKLGRRKVREGDIYACIYCVCPLCRHFIKVLTALKGKTTHLRVFRITSKFHLT